MQTKLAFPETLDATDVATRCYKNILILPYPTEYVHRLIHSSSQRGLAPAKASRSWNPPRWTHQRPENGALLTLEGI